MNILVGNLLYVFSQLDGADDARALVKKERRRVLRIPIFLNRSQVEEGK